MSQTRHMLTQFPVPSLRSTPRVSATDESKMDEQYVVFSGSPSLTAPSLSQLNALSAVPYGTTPRNHRRGRHSQRTLPRSVCDLAFPASGTYPNMNHTLTNEDTISLQMTETMSSVVSTSTTLTTYYAANFTLGGFGGSSAITAVFDNYKIDLLEVWLVPNITEAYPGNGEVGQYSTCVDLDDSVTPASYNTVSDHQQSVTSSVLAGHHHRWQPRFATSAYSGAFTSFGTSMGWLDSASPNVQHYGIKFSSTPTTTVVSYSIVVRATFSFRAGH
jgi:hypothetical protein